MAVATGAILTAAQNLLDGTFRELVNQIRSENGLSEEEAKDLFFNMLVDLAVNSATVGAILRTKLAVKTAEWLGLSSKGLVKRKLTPKAAAVAAKGISVVDKKKALGLIARIFKKVGSPVALFWLFLGFTQFVEQGVYQAKTANDQYERFIGIRPFAEKGFSLAPANFQADTFAKYAQSLETAGVKGFNDPVNRQSRVYSREDLAAIVDWVYGKAVLEGKTFSDWRGVVPLVTPYLIGGTNNPSPSSSQQNTSTTSMQTSSTKVFTGLVSQGVVGAGLSFTPRPDDLIESMGELQQAINNNVSPFLASLLSRVTYEIKVVPTVVVNGLQMRGQAQQIQSGNFADGSPKFRTVVNKFAVANLYLITDRGTRSKVGSIVLGPTNAVKFQPTSGELLNIAAAVPKNVITSNTDDIDVVVSGTPTLSVAPATPEAPVSVPSIGYTFVYDGYKGSVSFNTATVDRLRNEVASGFKTVEQAMSELFERHVPQANEFGGTSGGPDSWANENPNVVRSAYEMAPDKIRALLTTGGIFTGTPQKTTPKDKPAAPTIPLPAVEQKQRPPSMTIWLGPGVAEDDLRLSPEAYGKVAIDRAPEGAAPNLTILLGPGVAEDDLILEPGALGKVGINRPLTSRTQTTSSASTLYEFYNSKGEALPSLSARGALYQQLGLGQSAFYTGTAEQNMKLLKALQGTPL
jgi:hypothetical protein